MTKALTWLLILATTTLIAQGPYRVHSHNDYRQEVPFWYAYSSGAASIEVDLVLKDDSLYVAHAAGGILPGRTFSSLYLDELNRLAEHGRLRPVQLLIDLKTEAYATLDSVTAAIARYPELVKENQLTFVISGNRPRPADYPEYPDYIFFDHQDLGDLAGFDLSKVALISRPFQAYSVWNGYGRMTAADLARVDSVIGVAHRAGKAFRFWGTPDTKTAWAEFAELGVDFINSDKPAKAHAFLTELPERSYATDRQTETYIPDNVIDIAGNPRNIILMIGDGNGLAQISAARTANRGKLSLTNISHIGLVNTASADDAVTDSAAAGTAMATGQKTNNRAIGVDTAGRPLQTLVELLSDEGYRTGIITTDAIDGATPAAFYAHTAERDDSDKIIGDLLDSDLSFFIAGGQLKEDKIEAGFARRSLQEFDGLEVPIAVYNGTGNMPSVRQGRGDFLPESVARALSVMRADPKPFFLLVEGAQIDSGGHANDIATIITEMLDFDRAVGEALRFADTDGETLVIITADHETGGFGIAGGTGDGQVRGDFLSVDHSGVLVPLFAYGPQAAAFIGVFENTAIFSKILSALGVGE